VEMRSCAGILSRSHPSARECCKARRARNYHRELVVGGGLRASVAAAFSSSDKMRLRISAAAALVKVMATMRPGSSTSLNRRRNRRVSRSVLPDPAGRLDQDRTAGVERLFALALIGRRRAREATHRPPPIHFLRLRVPVRRCVLSRGTANTSRSVHTSRDNPAGQRRPVRQGIARQLLDSFFPFCQLLGRKTILHQA